MLEKEIETLRKEEKRVEGDVAMISVANPEEYSVVSNFEHADKLQRDMESNIEFTELSIQLNNEEIKKIREQLKFEVQKNQLAGEYSDRSIEQRLMNQLHGLEAEYDRHRVLLAQMRDQVRTMGRKNRLPKSKRTCTKRHMNWVKAKGRKSHCRAKHQKRK
jgi:predicted Zn-dependent protease